MKVYRSFQDAFKWVPIAALIALGFWARAADLGTHFTHIDDVGVARTILAFKRAPPVSPAGIARRFSEDAPAGSANARIFAALAGAAERLPSAGIRALDLIYRVSSVPAAWTYAPAQFVLTYFLVRDNQSYRDILFYGRLPSFLAGVLGLFMVVGLYAAHDRLRSPAVVACLALVALSWENVIYAKQMQSYAFGVSASFAVLWALFRVRSALATAALLAAASLAQYQIILMVPAFFAARVLVPREKNRGFPGRLAAAAAGFLAYAAIMAPFWIAFLSRHAGRGVTYLNAGTYGEFHYTGGLAPAHWPEAAAFLARNFWAVLGNNLAVVPETHALHFPLTAAMTALFAVGTWSFLRSRRPAKRVLGAFLAFYAATWVAMIVTGHLTLGPSRHALVLLCPMAVVTAEGWAAVFGALSGGLGVRNGRLHLAAVVLLAALFTAVAPGVIAARRDPVDEARIGALLKRHGVQTVVEYDSLTPGLIKELRAEYNFVGFFRRHGKYESFRRAADPAAPVAFISTVSPLNAERYARLAREVGAEFGAREWDGYEVLHREERASDVEIEFSPRARKNGANGLFVYVLKPASQ